MAMEPIHQSVLPEAVLELLAPTDPTGVIVDATLGEGGHAKLFLEHFPRIRLVALDADPVMLRRARERLADFSDRVEFRTVWFDDYFAGGGGTEVPHRVLLDLGVSMYHFRGANRGFSLSEDGALDMRLNPEAPLSAGDIVNRTPEAELADLIYAYGEERLSRRIARAIVRARQEAPIDDAAALAEIVRRAVPKEQRYRRIHPATRTFQALRIAVNDELGRLGRVLEGATDVLPPGGRIGVISFHSLEDRIVKRFFLEKERPASGDAPVTRPEPAGRGPKAVFRRVNRKPIAPSEEEVGRNPAARSAKFRVLERVAV
jgi:16S rRNA (cytosine1402-N4)-methyltransferase